MSLPSGVAVAGLLLVEASTETLLSSDTLTVNGGGLTIVGAESGTTDNLATLNIGTNFTLSGNQLIVFLTATIGDSITIKHNTGNIVCNTGADIVMTENMCVMLVRFISTTNAVVNSKWRAIS